VSVSNAGTGNGFDQVPFDRGDLSTLSRLFSPNSQQSGKMPVTKRKPIKLLSGNN
jgi:hypothetical protein